MVVFMDCVFEAALAQKMMNDNIVVGVGGGNKQEALYRKSITYLAKHCYVTVKDIRHASNRGYIKVTAKESWMDK